jgi:hypothetical protein
MPTIAHLSRPLITRSYYQSRISPLHYLSIASAAEFLSPDYNILFIAIFITREPPALAAADAATFDDAYYTPLLRITFISQSTYSSSMFAATMPLH